MMKRGSFPWNKIIMILAFATVTFIRGRLVHNAINLRANPILVQENKDTTPLIGAFARIPQEALPPPDYEEDFPPKTFIPKIASLGAGCTNQIARVLYPDKPFNETSKAYEENNDHYLKIPILSQPFSEYKIIVATAPWDIKITGSEAKPAVIYFVFPGDDDDPNSMNIPEIYFVKRGRESRNLRRKDKIDPLIIVDSNRTVTGLKSKTVSKFIKFKNKLNQ